MARRTDPKPIALLTLLLAGAVFSDCASKGGAREENVASIRQVILKTVFYRRPAGPGADPKAGPGGEDYVSHPLPDERLDCRPLRELHAGRDLAKARACLASLKGPGRVVYRLRRLAEPRLELVPEESGGEKTPECLKRELATLPVPRELVFQSADSGYIECYASRLNIEADDVPALGVKWPLSRTQLAVTLPIEDLPEEPEKVGLLLDTWAMSLFLKPGENTLPSRLMPERICEHCLGEKTLVRPGSPPEQLWPEIPAQGGPR